MTVSNPPICLSAVRPFPGIFIVYSKLYKIVVFRLIFFHCFQYNRFKDCYCSVLPEKIRYYDLCWLLATQPYITARVRWVSIYLSFTSVARPPRLRAVTFLSFICRIYTTGFGQYLTSSCLADSSVLYMPYMRFLFVRPRVCFRLTSDSTSRWTPLPSANTSYCQACSGLSPPSYCPFRAN